MSNSHNAQLVITLAKDNLEAIADLTKSFMAINWEPIEVITRTVPECAIMTVSAANLNVFAALRYNAKLGYLRRDSSGGYLYVNGIVVTVEDVQLFSYGLVQDEVLLAVSNYTVFDAIATKTHEAAISNSSFGHKTVTPRRRRDIPGLIDTNASREKLLREEASFTIPVDMKGNFNYVCNSDEGMSKIREMWENETEYLEWNAYILIQKNPGSNYPQIYVLRLKYRRDRIYAGLDGVSSPSSQLLEELAKIILKHTTDWVWLGIDGRELKFCQITANPIPNESDTPEKSDGVDTVPSNEVMFEEIVIENNELIVKLNNGEIQTLKVRGKRGGKFILESDNITRFNRTPFKDALIKVLSVKHPEEVTLNDCSEDTNSIELELGTGHVNRVAKRKLRQLNK